MQKTTNTFLACVYTIATVLSFSSVKAQTTKPDIITTTGDYFSNVTTGSLSWTLGEPVIETYSGGGNILTQGFQQSRYNVTAVEDVTKPSVNIGVYPNPFASAFTISTDASNPLHARVIDLSGKVICEKNITTSQTQINLGTLSDALYLLKVYDNSGTIIKTFKLEKVK